MIILGIVGSPAGGKSTVAAHLQELGATWINADLIAREVLQRDEVQKRLVSHFGSDITGNDGRIDRRSLASRVFGDDDVRRAALIYLESVIHPQTREMITQRLKEASGDGLAAAALDIPLLFKTGWDRCCDEIWCVDASREVRAQRAAKRGWSDRDLRNRELNQLDIVENHRLSNFVIVNDGTFKELTDTIDGLWSSLIVQTTEIPDDNHCLKDN